MMVMVSIFCCTLHCRCCQNCQLSSYCMLNSSFIKHNNNYLREYIGWWRKPDSTVKQIVSVGQSFCLLCQILTDIQNTFIFRFSSKLDKSDKSPAKTTVRTNNITYIITINFFSLPPSHFHSILRFFYIFLLVLFYFSFISSYFSFFPRFSFLCLFTTTYYKNSSGDEIANVNFLRLYGTYVLQNTKKENLLRLTN